MSSVKNVDRSNVHSDDFSGKQTKYADMQFTLEEVKLYVDFVNDPDTNREAIRDMMKKKGIPINDGYIAIQGMVNKYVGRNKDVRSKQTLIELYKTMLHIAFVKENIGLYMQSVADPPPSAEKIKEIGAQLRKKAEACGINEKFMNHILIRPIRVELGRKVSTPMREDVHALAKIYAEAPKEKLPGQTIVPEIKDDRLSRLKKAAGDDLVLKVFIEGKITFDPITGRFAGGGFSEYAQKIAAEKIFRIYFTQKKHLAYSWGGVELRDKEKPADAGMKVVDMASFPKLMSYTKGAPVVMLSFWLTGLKDPQSEKKDHKDGPRPAWFKNDFISPELCRFIRDNPKIIFTSGDDERALTTVSGLLTSRAVISTGFNLIPIQQLSGQEQEAVAVVQRLFFRLFAQCVSSWDIGEAPGYKAFQALKVAIYKDATTEDRMSSGKFWKRAETKNDADNDINETFLEACLKNDNLCAWLKDQRVSDLNGVWGKNFPILAQAVKPGKEDVSGYNVLKFVHAEVKNFGHTSWRITAKDSTAMTILKFLLYIYSKKILSNTDDITNARGALLSIMQDKAMTGNTLKNLSLGAPLSDGEAKLMRALMLTIPKDKLGFTNDDHQWLMDNSIKHNEVNPSRLLSLFFVFIKNDALNDYIEYLSKDDYKALQKLKINDSSSWAYKVMTALGHSFPFSSEDFAKVYFTLLTHRDNLLPSIPIKLDYKNGNPETNAIMSRGVEVTQVLIPKDLSSKQISFSELKGLSLVTGSDTPGTASIGKVLKTYVKSYFSGYVEIASQVKTAGKTLWKGLGVYTQSDTERKFDRKDLGDTVDKIRTSIFGIPEEGNFVWNVIDRAILLGGMRELLLSETEKRSAQGESSLLNREARIVYWGIYFMILRMWISMWFRIGRVAIRGAKPYHIKVTHLGSGKEMEIDLRSAMRPFFHRRALKKVQAWMAREGLTMGTARDIAQLNRHILEMRVRSRIGIDGRWVFKDENLIKIKKFMANKPLLNKLIDTDTLLKNLDKGVLGEQYIKEEFIMSGLSKFDEIIKQGGNKMPRELRTLFFDRFKRKFFQWDMEKSRKKDTRETQARKEKWNTVGHPLVKGIINLIQPFTLAFDMANITSDRPLQWFIFDSLKQIAPDIYGDPTLYPEKILITRDKQGVDLISTRSLRSKVMTEVAYNIQLQELERSGMPPEQIKAAQTFLQQEYVEGKICTETISLLDRSFSAPVEGKGAQYRLNSDLGLIEATMPDGRIVNITAFEFSSSAEPQFVARTARQPGGIPDMILLLPRPNAGETLKDYQDRIKFEETFSKFFKELPGKAQTALPDVPVDDMKPEQKERLQALKDQYAEKSREGLVEEAKTSTKKAQGSGKTSKKKEVINSFLTTEEPEKAASKTTSEKVEARPIQLSSYDWKDLMRIMETRGYTSVAQIKRLSYGDYISAIVEHGIEHAAKDSPTQDTQVLNKARELSGGKLIVVDKNGLHIINKKVSISFLKGEPPRIVTKGISAEGQKELNQLFERCFLRELLNTKCYDYLFSQKKSELKAITRLDEREVAKITPRLAGLISEYRYNDVYVNEYAKIAGYEHEYGERLDSELQKEYEKLAALLLNEHDKAHGQRDISKRSATEYRLMALIREISWRQSLEYSDGKVPFDIRFKSDFPAQCREMIKSGLASGSFASLDAAVEAFRGTIDAAELDKYSGAKQWLKNKKVFDPSRNIIVDGKVLRYGFRQGIAMSDVLASGGETLVKLWGQFTRDDWILNGKRMYREQVIGGLVLADGCILAMGCGEGKTITNIGAEMLLATFYPQKTIFLLTSHPHLAEEQANEANKLAERVGMRAAYFDNDPKSTSKDVFKDKNTRIVYATFDSYMFQNIADRRDALFGKKGLMPDVQDRFVLFDEVDYLVVQRSLTPFMMSYGEKTGAEKIAGEFALLMDEIADELIKKDEDLKSKNDKAAKAAEARCADPLNRILRERLKNDPMLQELYKKFGKRSRTIEFTYEGVQYRAVKTRNGVAFQKRVPGISVAKNVWARFTLPDTSTADMRAKFQAFEKMLAPMNKTLFLELCGAQVRCALQGKRMVQDVEYGYSSREKIVYLIDKSTDKVSKDSKFSSPYLEYPGMPGLQGALEAMLFTKDFQGSYLAKFLPTKLGDRVDHRKLRKTVQKYITTSSSNADILMVWQAFNELPYKAGSTGTALVTADRFLLLQMATVGVPKHNPSRLIDKGTRFFFNKDSKYMAILDVIEKRFTSRNPNQLGIYAENSNEAEEIERRINELIKQKGLERERKVVVLDNKKMTNKAVFETLAKASLEGTIVIFTNAGGRGTDWMVAYNEIADKIREMQNLRNLTFEQALEALQTSYDKKIKDVRVKAEQKAGAMTPVKKRTDRVKDKIFGPETTQEAKIEEAALENPEYMKYQIIKQLIDKYLGNIIKAGGDPAQVKQLEDNFFTKRVFDEIASEYSSDGLAVQEQMEKRIDRNSIGGTIMRFSSLDAEFYAKYSNLLEKFTQGQSGEIISKKQVASLNEYARQLLELYNRQNIAQASGDSVENSVKTAEDEFVRLAQDIADPVNTEKAVDRIRERILRDIILPAVSAAVQSGEPWDESLKNTLKEYLGFTDEQIERLEKKAKACAGDENTLRTVVRRTAEEAYIQRSGRLVQGPGLKKIPFSADISLYHSSELLKKYIEDFIQDYRSTVRSFDTTSNGWQAYLESKQQLFGQRQMAVYINLYREFLNSTTKQHYSLKVPLPEGFTVTHIDDTFLLIDRNQQPTKFSSISAIEAELAKRNAAAETSETSRAPKGTEVIDGKKESRHYTGFDRAGGINRRTGIPQRRDIDGSRLEGRSRYGKGDLPPIQKVAKEPPVKKGGEQVVDIKSLAETHAMTFDGKYIYLVPKGIDAAEMMQHLKEGDDREGKQTLQTGQPVMMNFDLGSGKVQKGMVAKIEHTDKTVFILEKDSTITIKALESGMMRAPDGALVTTEKDTYVFFKDGEQVVQFSKSPIDMSKLDKANLQLEALSIKANTPGVTTAKNLRDGFIEGMKHQGKMLTLDKVIPKTSGEISVPAKKGDKVTIMKTNDGMVSQVDTSTKIAELDPLRQGKTYGNVTAAAIVLELFMGGIKYAQLRMDKANTRSRGQDILIVGKELPISVIRAEGFMLVCIGAEHFTTKGLKKMYPAMSDAALRRFGGALGMARGSFVFAIPFSVWENKYDIFSGNADLLAAAYSNLARDLTAGTISGVVFSLVLGTLSEGTCKIASGPALVLGMGAASLSDMFVKELWNRARGSMDFKYAKGSFGMAGVELVNTGKAVIPASAHEYDLMGEACQSAQVNIMLRSAKLETDNPKQKEELMGMEAYMADELQKKGVDLKVLKAQYAEFLSQQKGKERMSYLAFMLRSAGITSITVDHQYGYSLEIILEVIAQAMKRTDTRPEGGWRVRISIDNYSIETRAGLVAHFHIDLGGTGNENKVTLDLDSDPLIPLVLERTTAVTYKSRDDVQHADQNEQNVRAAYDTARKTAPSLYERFWVDMEYMGPNFSGRLPQAGIKQIKERKWAQIRHNDDLKPELISSNATFQDNGIAYFSYSDDADKLRPIDDFRPVDLIREPDLAKAFLGEKGYGHGTYLSLDMAKRLYQLGYLRCPESKERWRNHWPKLAKALMKGEKDEIKTEADFDKKILQDLPENMFTTLMTMALVAFKRDLVNYGYFIREDHSKTAVQLYKYFSYMKRNAAAQIKADAIQKGFDVKKLKVADFAQRDQQLIHTYQKKMGRTVVPKSGDQVVDTVVEASLSDVWRTKNKTIIKTAVTEMNAFEARLQKTFERAYRQARLEFGKIDDSEMGRAKPTANSEEAFLQMVSGMFSLFGQWTEEEQVIYEWFKLEHPKETMNKAQFGKMLTQYRTMSEEQKRQLEVRIQAKDFEEKDLEKVLSTRERQLLEMSSPEDASKGGSKVSRLFKNRMRFDANFLGCREALIMSSMYRIKEEEIPAFKKFCRQYGLRPIKSDQAAGRIGSSVYSNLIAISSGEHARSLSARRPYLEFKAKAIMARPENQRSTIRRVIARNDREIDQLSKPLPEIQANTDLWRKVQPGYIPLSMNSYFGHPEIRRLEAENQVLRAYLQSLQKPARRRK